MSLRFKFLSSILFVTLVVWGVAAYYSYKDTQLEVDRIFDAHLIESAQAIIQQAGHERREMNARNRHDGHDDRDKRKPDGDDEEDDDEFEDHDYSLTEIKLRGELFEKRLVFQVWDSSGALLIMSGQELKNVRAADGFSYSDEGATPLRIFSQWSKDKTLKVVVAESVEARRSLANSSVKNVLSPILWMILPLLVMLTFIVEATLKPVRRLSEDVELRSVNDLTPIEERGTPKELRSTVTALNRLFNRLARAIENERRFTSDAAHELRTPLAAIKIQAQVAFREQNARERNKALEATILGVDRATHLVEQLLTLARLDPDTSAPQDQISIREVVIEVLQSIVPTALSKSIEIELNEGPDPLVRGKHAMLAIMVRNLVDNAVRYTPAGGKVTVKIELRGSKVEFVVEDSGPGLNEQQMKSIGERFNRISRPSGEGSGLGLSIVQRIAAIHQAEIKLTNKDAESGLLAKVTFPRS